MTHKPHEPRRPEAADPLIRLYTRPDANPAPCPKGGRCTPRFVRRLLLDGWECRRCGRELTPSEALALDDADLAPLRDELGELGEHARVALEHHRGLWDDWTLTVGHCSSVLELVVLEVCAYPDSWTDDDAFLRDIEQLDRELECCADEDEADDDEIACPHCGHAHKGDDCHVPDCETCKPAGDDARPVRVEWRRKDPKKGATSPAGTDRLAGDVVGPDFAVRRVSRAAKARRDEHLGVLDIIAGGLGLFALLLLASFGLLFMLTLVVRLACAIGGAS